MMLYVAGPMTGYPEYNFPAFYAAEERLVGLGFDVHNPAWKGVLDGWTWADYMRVDIRELTHCHGIYLLDHWWKSPGARFEHSVASQLGMSTTFEYWPDQRLLATLREE